MYMLIILQASWKHIWVPTFTYIYIYRDSIWFYYIFSSEWGGHPPHQPSMVGHSPRGLASPPVATPVRAVSTRKVDIPPPVAKQTFTPTRSPDQKKVKTEHQEAMPKALSKAFFSWWLFVCFWKRSCHCVESWEFLKNILIFLWDSSKSIQGAKFVIVPQTQKHFLASPNIISGLYANIYICMWPSFSLFHDPACKGGLAITCLSCEYSAWLLGFAIDTFHPFLDIQILPEKEFLVELMIQTPVFLHLVFEFPDVGLI